MSRREPVLASCELTDPAESGRRVTCILRVEGGLRFLKGNSSPHFTLTGSVFRKGFDPDTAHMFGCLHDLILKRFPKFADLAALHLSDIDGQPMHAEANGWYWLAGALGGMGERHHGGNGKSQHWKPDGEFDGYRESTPAECLAVFADHCRIPLAEAEAIRDRCLAAILPNPWGTREHYVEASRDAWRAVLESMRPRWKAEADACVARHGLVVFGDPWPPMVVA